MTDFSVVSKGATPDRFNQMMASSTQKVATITNPTALNKVNEVRLSTDSTISCPQLGPSNTEAEINT